jgi:hypothetical protein
MATKTEYISVAKDWRDCGHEIEALGEKLDAARDALKGCKPNTWAHSFWTQTADRLFIKWKLTVTMHEVGLKQQGPQGGIHRSYDWFENSEEIRMVSLAVLDNLFHNAGLSQRLDESWAKSKELKLERARQGLA